MISMRVVLAVCFTATLGTTLPAALTGQVTRADSAAVLLSAGNGFEAAGQWEVAEAIYLHLVERFAETTAAASAQTRLINVRRAGVEGAGSVELQVWTTSYGLFIGTMVPLAFDAEAPEPYGLGLLIGGPSGFLIGRTVARSRALTEGQARAITWGGTWGTWQGFGWAMVLDLGSERRCAGGYCYDTDEEAPAVAGVTILGGLTGILIGSALSSRMISPGTATAVNLGSLWGSWFGFALGVLADQEDDALLGATLIGGNAGLLTTAVLAPGWNVTRNRARLVSLAGLLGGVVGLGVDLIAQPEDEKAAVAIPLATSVLGLSLGMAGTRDRAAPDTPGEDAGGALLNLRDGSWSVGAPLPLPIPTSVEGPRGYRRGVALALPLLHGSFRGF
jgi:hypothetical protein